MDAVKTQKLTVGFEDGRYDILIGKGLLRELGGLLAPFRKNAPLAVVSDENVWVAHGETFASSVDSLGSVIILPPGEGIKSLEGLSRLYGDFARRKLTRNGLVVAFGGGVIGDLAGFAAATWMRGVRLVQVPTTLLAQVDSSVGGKTAINLPQGKNLAGAFHQPELTVIDPAVLDSLPERERRCGMAEVVKYGAIRSRPLFEALGNEEGEPDLAGLIHVCCQIKAEIVARDERDFGERMLLNFGHTLGHAIEKSGSFETYRHGEAVAMGMVLAARAGEAMGLTEPGTVNALCRVLTTQGLKTEYPGDLMSLFPLLSADKKSAGDGVQMVLLRRVGEAFTRHVAFEDLKKIF